MGHLRADLLVTGRLLLHTFTQIPSNICRKRRYVPQVLSQAAQSAATPVSPLAMHVSRIESVIVSTIQSELAENTWFLPQTLPRQPPSHQFRQKPGAMAMVPLFPAISPRTAWQSETVVLVGCGYLSMLLQEPIATRCDLPQGRCHTRHQYLPLWNPRQKLL